MLLETKVQIQVLNLRILLWSHLQMGTVFVLISTVIHRQMINPSLFATSSNPIYANLSHAHLKLCSILTCRV